MQSFRDIVTGKSSFNFLASLINGNNDTAARRVSSFNFLASLINGNEEIRTQFGDYDVATFNFLASLINGNSAVICALERLSLPFARKILLTS